MQQRSILFALILVFMAAVIRVLPHPLNFTPLAAMGLFGAAYFKRMWAFAVPFLALFLSDLFLNNVIYSQYFTSFAWITSVWQYVAYLGVLLVGFFMLKTRRTAFRVLGASLSASGMFFLLSNLGVFVEGTMYPKTVGGLLACYTAGLPFLTNTILGDLCFSALLFGSYQWFLSRQGQRVAA